MSQIIQSTNIRFHIYKELSKYRKLQERHGTDRINEVAIPIITGIVVVFITNRLASKLNEINDLCYFGFIVVIAFAYGLLLIIIKYLYFYYVNRIKPNINPIKKTKANNRLFSLKQEEDAAKFNYEVTYLVESAYNQINRVELHDRFLFRMSLLNALFSIKNALRKIQESLLGESGKISNGLVSNSMIELVLDMLGETLNKIKIYSCSNDLYIEDVDFIIGKYKDVEEQIKKIYQL